jgi:hypothetical protein
MRSIRHVPLGSGPKPIVKVEDEAFSFCGELVRLHSTEPATHPTRPDLKEPPEDEASQDVRDGSLAGPQRACHPRLGQSLGQRHVWVIPGLTSDVKENSGRYSQLLEGRLDARSKSPLSLDDKP